MSAGALPSGSVSSEAVSAGSVSSDAGSVSAGAVSAVVASPETKPVFDFTSSGRRVRRMTVPPMPPLRKDAPLVERVETPWPGAADQIGRAHV